VDFGEFHAVVAGVLLKLWMFVMRLSCSGRAFHVAFATQAQEAFLEGHVLALGYFGAVPGRVRYDNLGPAVVRVLRGRIASGEYAPGSALPAITALAAEFGVTTNTVRKALGILKDEALIESVPGYGTFVRK
jgi:Bacterial regulatory proteins, gntR family